MREKRNLYELLSDAYERSIDTRMMGTRKSVLMTGVEKLGYMGSILVFKKANLSEYKLGEHVVNGWIVREKVGSPANSKDGFIICTRESGQKI